MFVCERRDPTGLLRYNKTSFPNCGDGFPFFTIYYTSKVVAMVIIPNQTRKRRANIGGARKW